MGPGLSVTTGEEQSASTSQALEATQQPQATTSKPAEAVAEVQHSLCMVSGSAVVVGRVPCKAWRHLLHVHSRLPCQHSAHS